VSKKEARRKERKTERKKKSPPSIALRPALCSVHVRPCGIRSIEAKLCLCLKVSWPTALICHELRVKLGQLDALASEVFALTVFLCDGLLHLKPASHPASGAFRFFSIASKMPMELQLILCHRIVGSQKQNILHKDSEVAFKGLARNLLR